MTKFKYLISCVLLLFISCKEQKTSIPSNVLPEDKMVEVLTDVRLAEANARVARQMQQYEEHLLDSAYFVIYKLHDINTQQLKESLEYYGERPELLKKINEKVLENLNLIN